VQTIENWSPEIEAFCKTGITNAKSKGTNRLINDVGRRACGFRNPTTNAADYGTSELEITPEHSQTKSLPGQI
jgi:hypothetical protein